MKLFHETENKYYQLILYMLHHFEAFTTEEIVQVLSVKMTSEVDYEVLEQLFSKKEGKEAVFSYKNGKYTPLLEQKMPIRTTVLENETFRTIFDSPYARHFLSQETIEKGRCLTANIEMDWNPNHIRIKNQFCDGAGTNEKDYERAIAVILSAIRNHHGIIYDNVRPGKYEFIKAKVFPVKIEYSFVNDKFWIIAFDPNQYTFIKMQLISMSNIEENEEVREGLVQEYESFARSNICKIVLDVEPVDHVIERCFRIFSYYERKAIFDETINKYKLEILYQSFDEKEVIRDILSLGSSVMVTEPKRIQREVYRRIRLAAELYEE